MAQDAFTIMHTAKELDKTLVGGKINKITQPGKEELFFYVYAGGKSFTLAICVNAKYAYVCPTLREKENPAVCPNFCMLLRKHLLSATITSVRQVEFERIIIIDFLCKNEFSDTQEKSLIVEIMGKYSNAILVKDGVVLGALKTTALELNAVRPLFSGIKYVLPKKQDKISPFDKENSIIYLKNYNGENLSDYLFKGFLGISDFTAKEIAYRFGKDIAKPEVFLSVIMSL